MLSWEETWESRLGIVLGPGSSDFLEGYIRLGSKFELWKKCMVMTYDGPIFEWVRTVLYQIIMLKDQTLRRVLRWIGSSRLVRNLYVVWIGFKKARYLLPMTNRYIIFMSDLTLM